jgi:predicted alpha/beta-fold hydrolase
MEGILGTAVGKLVAMGGAYLFGAIMLALYFLERKSNAKLQDTVLCLSREQTQAIVTFSNVLDRVKETLSEVARRI